MPIPRRGDIYAGRDVLEVPTYSLPEAAHYVRIPAATLRSWVIGQSYPTEQGEKWARTLIFIADREHRLMSFINLVEVHVLDAIRREHRVHLSRVRQALDYLQRRFPSEHPLAEQAMETDGRDLFVEKYGALINVSREGQTTMRNLLDAHLGRVERDAKGVPIRLYPFTRKRQPDEPKAIVIDPRVAFGRPVLAHSGIPTAVIAERYKAWESIQELAEDYGREPSEIEGAIRCELGIEAA